MSTTLIKKGYLLDPDLPFERGDILIEDDKITQVAPNIDFRADTTINALDKIVMPGLTSAHCHLFTTMHRAFTDRLQLDAYVLYNFYTPMAQMSPRENYIWTAISAAELLKTGTTSLLEHGPLFFPANGVEQTIATADALTDVGIRAVVCPFYRDVIYSKSLSLHLLSDVTPEDVARLDVGGEIKTKDQIAALRSLLKLERWRDRNALVNIGLGPERLHGVTRKLLEATVELSSEFDVPIHTHMLSTKSQVPIANKVFGKTSAEYLAEMNCLGPHVSLAHGVWIDNNEMRIIAENNTSIVHCPIANIRIGGGIAPVQQWKNYGINAAVGVDDAGGANDAQNTFEVMKWAAVIHRLYGISSEWIGSEDALRMGMKGGAKVLRKSIGSLKPGNLADLLILGTDHLFMMPKENFINQIVYWEKGDSIEKVMVGGRVVVEDRKVKTVDEKALYAEAKESIKNVYADMDAVNKKAAPALDFVRRLEVAVNDWELPYSRLAKNMQIPWH